MNQFDCHVLESAPSQSEHTHEYGQLILPLVKPLILRCGGQEYYISPSHLGFVPPMLPHSCVCPSQVVTINIPGHMIKPADVEILSQQKVLPIEGALVPLIELIKDEIKHNPNSYSVRYLYYYLYDKLVENNGIKSLRYIRDHFSEPVRVAHLAKLENYNISYFNNWFKRQTGFSPFNYIRHLRIEKAKELLLTTHYSLINIAMQVGYNSNSSFTRAFKESVGMSPNQWKQMNLPSVKR